jgi:outer membrane protein assembly factor BamB
MHKLMTRSIIPLGTVGLGLVFLMLPCERAGAQDAVAYQHDPAHDGSVTMNGFSPIPRLIWSQDLGGIASPPVIVQGKLYSTVEGTNTATLMALDATSGHLVWSAPSTITYPGTNYPSYDNGRIFVVNTNQFVGTLNAYDANSGASLWSSVLTGQYSFSSQVTAANGVAYTSGSGSSGTVYALNEATGATIWTAFVLNGDESSPAVTSDGVYVAYLGPQTYKLNPQTGKVIWQRGGNEGGGGNTASYYNGRVYFNDLFNFSSAGPYDAVDAATGALSFNFGGNIGIAYGFPPAFYNGRGYLDEPSLIEAFDPATGSIEWTRQISGDSFDTPPTVVNGVVYVGTMGGQLYILDGSSGLPIDVLDIGASIHGLAAGDGLLAVSTGNSLNAYAVPEPSTLVLVTFGAAWLLFIHRRRRLEANARAVRAQILSVARAE